jgi:hypothetical protein
MNFDQGGPTRSEMIAFLIGEKFPDQAAIKASRAATVRPGAGPRSAKLARRAQELDIYRQQLSSMPLDELRRHYATALQARRQATEEQTRLDQERFAEQLMVQQAAARERALQQEQQRIWNQPCAAMNIAHWARAPIWTLDEATALSLGKDPRWVNWQVVGPHMGESPFAEAYGLRRDLLMRAKAVGELNDPDHPTRFLFWLKRASLPLSDELWAETHTWSSRPPSRRDRSPPAAPPTEGQQPSAPQDRGLADDRDDVIAELERQHIVDCHRIKELEQKLAAAQKLKRQSNPKVMESLRKLAIGMATKHYRIDPANPRNTATRRIRDDLALVGISLDDQTILNRLREAAELLPKD